MTRSYGKKIGDLRIAVGDGSYEPLPLRISPEGVFAVQVGEEWLTGATQQEVKALATAAVRAARSYTYDRVIEYELQDIQLVDGTIIGFGLKYRVLDVRKASNAVQDQRIFFHRVFREGSGWTRSPRVECAFGVLDSNVPFTPELYAVFERISAGINTLYKQLSAVLEGDDAARMLKRAAKLALPAAS